MTGDRGQLVGLLAELIDNAVRFRGSAPPVVTVSAKTGKMTHRIMPALRQAEEAYHRRVPTAALNQVLKDMRRAGKWDDDEEGNDSLGGQTLFEMIDAELASSLSKSNGGLGLGNCVEQVRLVRLAGVAAAGQ